MNTIKFEDMNELSKCTSNSVILNSNLNKYLKTDKESALKWLKEGAQPTDTAKNILSEVGVMAEFHKSKRSK